MNHNFNKKRAKRVLWVFGILLTPAFFVAYVPIYLPCLFKTLTTIPCPACGLTRAFIFAAHFNIPAAISMNILFLPLALGAAAYLSCAVKDAFSKEPDGNSALKRFNALLNKKWVIALAATLMLTSWAYNITRGL
jgi:hypothetical protein